MNSPRLLAALALLAAVAALPTTDKPINSSKFPNPITTIAEDDLDDTPWFTFPMFTNLFAPLWRLLPSFGDFGPRISADDDQFKVIVNVKDYKKDDLKVKVKGDFIFVQGTHETKQDDRDVFASQFFHTYTLPANSSGDDVTAQLTSDGYLVVDAPLNGPVNRGKSEDRDVKIVETGKPLPKEEPTTNKEVEKATHVPLVDNEDDRKEPTTPATSTDKDNNIPSDNPIVNEIP